MAQTEQTVGTPWILNCLCCSPKCFRSLRLKPPQRRHAPDYEACRNRENIHAQIGVVSLEQRFEVIIQYNSQPSWLNE